MRRGSLRRRNRRSGAAMLLPPAYRKSSSERFAFHPIGATSSRSSERRSTWPPTRRATGACARSTIARSDSLRHGHGPRIAATPLRRNRLSHVRSTGRPHTRTRHDSPCDRNNLSPGRASDRVATHVATACNLPQPQERIRSSASRFAVESPSLFRGSQSTASPTASTVTPALRTVLRGSVSGR